MQVHGQGERHRVFVPQALGSDEFLRVTWHESREVMVFSHWQGDRCVAATPVRVADLGEVASLTATAVSDSLQRGHPAWPAPDPLRLIVPAAGLTLPVERRSECA